MTGFEPERLKVLCIAPTDYVQKKIEAYSASLRLHVTAELLCEFALTKFGPNIYAHAIRSAAITARNSLQNRLTNGLSGGT